MNQYRQRCKEAQECLEAAKSQYDEWRMPHGTILFKQLDSIGRSQVVLWSNGEKKFAKHGPLKDMGIDINELPDYDEFKNKVAPLRRQINQIESDYRKLSVGIINDAISSKLYIFYNERRSAYEDYLSSEEWESKRQQCFNYHGRVCADCKINDATDIHHLHYDTLGDESPIDDLVPLCRVCHAARHEA